MGPKPVPAGDIKNKKQKSWIYLRWLKFGITRCQC